MLLDNSLNTDEQHFSLVCGFLRHNNIKTDFSQGLDIRRLTDYQALCLSSVPLWKQIHFAWDNASLEKSVKKGVDLLIKHGLKNKSMFYVLIGFDSTREED